jgi:hypothetical protein
MPYIEKQEADEVIEACREADVKYSITEAKWGWRVGVLHVPDVGRFVRALFWRGVVRVENSAGTGWDFFR